MKQFLAENWAWIVVPFMTVFIALAIFVYASSGSSSGDDPFIYAVF